MKKPAIFNEEEKGNDQANKMLLYKLKHEENDMPKLLFTTVKSSCGYNFYKLCTVIMMQEPTEWAMYKQQVGRSNRVSFKGDKKAVLITDVETSQEVLEQKLLT